MSERSEMDAARNGEDRGFFGEFGGQFVPESVETALNELEAALYDVLEDEGFQREFSAYLEENVGRPSPLYFAENLTDKYGPKIYLKREDLNHMGAHKINNTIGQALLASRMGKKKIIAETGAGQHGVATATVAAMFGLDCRVFMGEKDVRRQELNVHRMKLLGAEVIPVTRGTSTLSDAVDAALEFWIENLDDTYYLLGSAVGPHPYPTMVREFQSIIGRETREQVMEKEGRLPDYLLACVGGGSNAIGLFHDFIEDEEVELIGLEAGGRGEEAGEHAAALSRGETGIGHGFKSYLLQDENGDISPVHSIAAGLDYPGVGPEHSALMKSGRASYRSVRDEEAVKAFRELSKLEGILPALESSHALAYLPRLAQELKEEEIIVVNLSGRGDKDVKTVADRLDL